MREALKTNSHDKKFELTVIVFNEVINEGNPEHVREFICRCSLAFFRAEARGWLEVNGHGKFDYDAAFTWSEKFKSNKRNNHHGR